MNSDSSISRTRYLWVYYSCLVAVGLMVGILGPTLGALALQTGTDLKGVSIILAMRPLGYLGGTLVSGRLLDRMPGHPILAGAAVLAACVLALIPLTSTLAILAALVLVMGFAQGLLDVGSNTLIVWVYQDKVGPYLNGMHFAFGLGAFLGPVMVAQSLHWTTSSHATFWVLALCLLPLLLLLLRVSSPAHEQSPDQEQLSNAPWNLKLATLFILFFFLYGGSEAGFGAWIYSYATRLNLSNAVDAAYLSSAFWGLLGIGRLIGIPIVAKIPPRTFLSLLIPIVLLSLGLLLWGPQNHRILWVATAGTGLGLASIFPTLLIYAGRKLSHGGRVSGKITSFFFIGSSSGSMLIPWLMGQTIEPWGPKAAMGITLGALSLMGLVFIAILRQAD